MVVLRRLFVAVSLDDESRHRLAAQVGELDIPGKPGDPAKWHLTLRFLGNTDDATADRIVQALDEADLGPPFDIAWGGLGAFPRPSKATVLWVAITRGAEELRELAAAVEAALDRAGIPAEDRPFRPHLTISRIRPPQDVIALVDSVEPFGGSTHVGEVVLMESHLRGRHGSVYECVEAFGLR